MSPNPKNSPTASMGDILIKMVKKFQLIYFHQIIVKSCVIYHFCLAINDLLYAVVWRHLLFSKKASNIKQTLGNYNRWIIAYIAHLHKLIYFNATLFFAVRQIYLRSIVLILRNTLACPNDLKWIATSNSQGITLISVYSRNPIKTNCHFGNKI